MAASYPVVRVGVGVFVLKSTNEDPTNPRFLMGKRIGSHGNGSMSLPGGHLEFEETPQECAAREVLEETGLQLLSQGNGLAPRSEFLTATNDIMPADRKHYITMFMVSAREDDDAEPRNLEPEKCEGWEWVSWKTLEAMATKQIAGEKQDRTLFIPLLSLFQQRPGVIPSIRHA